jgi:hypothetical protein
MFGLINVVNVVRKCRKWDLSEKEKERQYARIKKEYRNVSRNCESESLLGLRACEREREIGGEKRLRLI